VKPRDVRSTVCREIIPPPRFNTPWFQTFSINILNMSTLCLHPLLWKSTNIYTNHGFWMFLAFDLHLWRVFMWLFGHGGVTMMSMGTDPVRSQGFCGFFFHFGRREFEAPRADLHIWHSFDSPFLWCIGIETTAFCAKMKSHDSGTHLLHCPSWTFRPALGLDTASLFWN
jgi:hypothetical protein